MFSGKHILITGANGGIGYAISKLLLKHNAHLILFYHKKRQNIDSLTKNHSDNTQNIEIHQIDLTNEKELDNIINSILKKHQIDIFIHLPTYQTIHKDIMKMNWSDFQKHIDLQTKSFFQITKLVVPSMKAQKHGRIINVLTSYVIGRPPNGISDYIVGKYSLLGLSKCMASELGKFGIRINSVSPSMMNTPLIEQLPSKLKEITRSEVPLENRLADPVEVAGTILFLCSDNAKYITGENILVTGGHSMH